MKLSKKVLKALNEQIKLELESAYLYFSMAVTMKEQNIHGYAAWLTHQTEEEKEHADKIIDYVLSRGETPELESLELLKLEKTTALDFAKASLAHEQLVSDSILKLRKLAVEEDDVPTQLFLDWFVHEQVEEEDNAQAVVDLLAWAGDDVAALLKVDAILGKREE